MFKTKLTGKRLLYGAEMDGIEKVERVDLNEADMNKLEFVELKVKLREEHKNQKINNLRFRLRNWWCQCFLANIKKIVVGTRSPAGIVDEMTELDVRSIPKLVQVIRRFNFIYFFIGKFQRSGTFSFYHFRTFGHRQFA